MAKSYSKAKGRSITYKGYFHLFRELLDCEDFISLKGNSLKLLIDIGSQYNGFNNGDLCASMSVLKKRNWNSNQQLNKALKELLAKNLIMQSKQGGLNAGPTLYAITWQPIDECQGRLEIQPTTKAPRTFNRIGAPHNGAA